MLKLEQEVAITQEKKVELEQLLKHLEKTITESNASQERLKDKVKQLEKNTRSYEEAMKKVEENEDIKDVLDTKLPDDLRRLLNEAITAATTPH